jgi:transmembrane sensor
MKNFDESITDLITDESFQQWVRSPEPASNAYWQNWLAQHPERKTQAEQARAILLSVQFTKTPTAEIDQVGMWQKIQAQLEEAPDFTEQTHPATTGFWRRWMRVAAIITLLLLSGLSLYVYVNSDRAHTYTTDYGDSRVITLPDGSVVTLNARSTLRIASHWSPNHRREVWLDGEAFFEVKKNPESQFAGLPSSRFVVHTSDLQIEVLGTEFNVNNRREKTRVVLNSGKISLHRSDESAKPDLVMEPDELVEYSRNDRQLTKKKVDPALYSSWVQKRLVFKETPLSEIGQLLEDNYGLRLQFGNEQLAARKFTGSVASDNPEMLMTAITESFQLKTSRKDNVIRIY